MMPKIILTGNVGQDAVVSPTRNGNNMLKFSMATKQKQQTGEDKTLWWSITAFGTHADFHRGIKKGDKVMVIGRFEFAEFAKSDGSRGTAFNITADDLEQANHRWPDQDNQSTSTPSDLDDLPF